MLDGLSFVAPRQWGWFLLLLDWLQLVMFDCSLQLTELVSWDPLELLLFLELLLQRLQLSLHLVDLGLLLLLLLLVLFEFGISFSTLSINLLHFLLCCQFQLLGCLPSFRGCLRYLLLQFFLKLFVLLREFSYFRLLLFPQCLILLQLHCQLCHFRLPDSQIFVECPQLRLSTIIELCLLKSMTLVVILLFQFLDSEF